MENLKKIEVKSQKATTETTTEMIKEIVGTMATEIAKERISQTRTTITVMAKTINKHD
ncbi:hypothetical protein D3C80_1967270 [compost metagenome]